MVDESEKIRLGILAFLYNNGILHYNYGPNWRQNECYSWVNVTRIENPGDDPKKIKYHFEITWNGVTFPEYRIPQGYKTRN